MREILFRGYNKIVKKWYYGMLDKFDNKYLINDGSGTKSYVEEDSIGEYTGLVDKNDIMIFEGDRVTDKDGAGTVVFEKGIWYVVYDKNNLHFELGGMYVEIIGNTYEESLKEDNKVQNYRTLRTKNIEVYISKIKDYYDTKVEYLVAHNCGDVFGGYGEKYI